MNQAIQLFLAASLAVTEGRIGETITDYEDEFERELGGWGWGSGRTSSPTPLGTYAPTMTPTKAPHVQYHGRNQTIEYPERGEDYYTDDRYPTSGFDALKRDFSGGIGNWSGETWAWVAMMLTFLAVGTIGLAYMVHRLKIHYGMDDNDKEEALIGTDDDESLDEFVDDRTISSRTTATGTTQGNYKAPEDKFRKMLNWGSKKDDQKEMSSAEEK